EARTAELQAANSALKEREAQLRLVTNNLPVMITQIDVNLRYRFANNVFARWFAKPVDELVGASVAETVGPEMMALLQPHIDAALRGEAATFEAHFRYPDGVTRDVEINYVPQFNALSQADGYICLVVDITERKQAEAELNATKTLLQNTFTSLNDTLLVVEAGTRKILMCNPAVEKILGYSADELIGGTTEILYVDQAAYEEFGRRSRAALDSGEEFRTEFSFRRKDGTILDTENVVSPLLDDSGQRIGAISIIRDISERKRLEENFRRIVEKSPASISLKDLDGRYLLVNERFSEWFGHPANEIVGKSVNDAFPADTAARIRQDDIAVMQVRKTFEQEWDAPFADGKAHKLVITKFPVLDTRDKAIGIGTICTDMTELKAVEAQLQQAQKMELIGQLTGGMAHDFNNILAIIIGNLGLIEDYGVEGEFDRESAEIALRAAHKGAELTHRLLAYSRQQPLQAKKVRINEILPQFSQLARSTIGADIAVELKLAGDLWPATVDTPQLENALLNLTVNARDAMPQGGQLTIETANQVLAEDDTAAFEELEPGDYVMIAVSDNGAGMSGDVLKRVFEPFFTTKDVGEGSGLGLSMVFGFAKQSGGHVSISSELGAGTTVRIFLPKAQGTPETEPTIEDNAKERPKGNETILVVEDDEDVLNFLVRALTRLDYTVVAASHGQAALEVMATSSAIDLLLTDVILPGEMSGRDIAMAFREQFPMSGVLYSSGYTRDVLKTRGQLEDGAALLRKPYRPSVLAQHVRDILDIQ
nr:PAS domain-containing protein [Alphaproteobacteria bacterium]